MIENIYYEGRRQYGGLLDSYVCGFPSWVWRRGKSLTPEASLQGLSVQRRVIFRDWSLRWLAPAFASDIYIDIFCLFFFFYFSCECVKMCVQKRICVCECEYVRCWKGNVRRASSWSSWRATLGQYICIEEHWGNGEKK